MPNWLKRIFLRRGGTKLLGFGKEEGDPYILVGPVANILIDAKPSGGYTTTSKGQVVLLLTPAEFKRAKARAVEHKGEIPFTYNDYIFPEDLPWD